SERVREARDLGQPERGGAALDGVRGAEDLVDELAPQRIGFEAEQGLLERLEVLGRLLDEGLAELPRIDVVRTAAVHGNTRLMTWRSCWGWNGLTSQPVAPAALPACLRDS